MRNIYTYCFLVLLCLGFSGCDSGAPQNEEKKESAGTGYLTIKGSDTMVHLVSSWAEEFMKLHKDVEISVTGGGSGTGIAGLINGTTDICASSRRINEKEKELASGKGRVPVELSVALDGIAVIVHPQNPVEALSMEQLQGIFTGKITSWQEVGGANQDLLVFSRESSSGTYVFFQEHVMNRQDYTPRARLLPGTSALVQGVAADTGAIGYVGLGYVKNSADRIKAISILDKDGGTAIAPSDNAVKDGSYPIARALFLYTSGEAQGTAKDFVEFTLSEQGQNIVYESGYVSVMSNENKQ
ncbi:phosphate ABC transporter substrate-binding protein, PhoT family [Desulfocapsa sulfexigens DSM 10523]|uniref:Phosphate-binding protein n=1 Tax=Desulfocapsa sulfexigens (strain DSM 10523 / SB164P1) TaxID=1167006 RepID=M1P279_DESSD|nr:phosphate ABC transporter substrate-binding protein [Desulfocapsa sulfexigens]AGF77588.1 phosphate ABC transporter substrate-binding protein, PhoT family [Desulfocapsa sulfexigens DSM 10523]